MELDGGADCSGKEYGKCGPETHDHSWTDIALQMPINEGVSCRLINTMADSQFYHFQNSVWDDVGFQVRYLQQVLNPSFRSQIRFILHYGPIPMQFVFGYFHIEAVIFYLSPDSSSAIDGECLVCAQDGTERSECAMQIFSHKGE